jgi:UrcA family protein
MMKLSSTFVAMALALSATPAAAAGQSWRVGNNSYHIYFDDLDLSTLSGRAAALARVEKASARLCEAEPTGRDRNECTTEIAARLQTQWMKLARLERDSKYLAVR